ncbi:MAG TPA: hypothetical protein VFT04_01680 [Gemmatimonadales bacterium]|nr:hypothetical protein [Gemmatimonadales bacterium]
MRSLLFAIVTASVAIPAVALAQDSPRVARPSPVSCTPAARAEFDRGLVLLHHMTYPEAREAFTRAVQADARCAMAHWGVAMTLFQPLWPTRPGPAELRRGREAVEAAIAQHPAPRELSLIAAADAFYREPAADYWERIRRWERAMGEAHAAHPDDDEIAAFRALALLAVAPADTSSSSHAGRAAALLLGILDRDPHHPGAQHYLVHANDAPGREGDSPAVVRRYAAEAPENPHALHMPTHIYVRQGDWSAAVAGNRRAADAALAHPAGEQGELVWDEFPHAIEYLVYALLQQGADSAAAAELHRLRSTPRLEPTFKTAFHLASTAARHALERKAWREAAALPVREPGTLAWDRFPWPEAVTWFARGLGAAREASLPPAREAAARLGALERAATEAGEALFVRNIRLLRLELDAWILQGEGKPDSAVAVMAAAAELELATPKHAVTPAPTLPAHELLGDLLLAQERPADALVAYRRSLELYPHRFNSLLGAARAARDARAACASYEALVTLAGGSRRAAIAEARAFPCTGE